jgi:hypothetical protein
VLGEDAPIIRKRRVNCLHRVEIAFEGPGEIALAGEVGAVADPDRQCLGTERLADLDAFEIMLDRLAPGRGIGVGEGAELVGMRLTGRVRKGVRVHRVEAQAERRALLLQGPKIGDLVPGDMERHGRRRPRQLLDDGAVFKLVEYVARLAGAGETGEARAASADAP